MSTRQRRDPSFLSMALLTGAAGYLALFLWPGPFGSDGLKAAAAFSLAVAGIGTIRMITAGWRWLSAFRRYLRALRQGDTQGSAGWLSEKEARQQGLDKLQSGSRFIGVLGSTAIWLWTETHHLVLGPAGSSKSTAAIIPFLCALEESCLINDTKGELYETTAKLRAKKFGHRIVKLDPRDPDSEQINPLDFIYDLVIQNSPEALTLLRGIALQLYPEPAQEGQNIFFRNGTRRAMAAVIMAVVVALPPERRNLASVYRAFSDADFLHELLIQAGESQHLSGEVADMVEDLHHMVFGDEGSARTYEQFRIGALQALEPFGPGNYLARITAKTSFSFTELKTGKVSCYIIVDHNNKDTLGKWSGLMQWLAAYQLVQERNNKPVTFVLDEFCNAPLHSLPSILTLLRSYGVKCILATQDLDDITRVYGKHALETILSETDIKQFLGGIRSQTTLDFLSKYLGRFTEFAPSYSFDQGEVKESQSRSGRPLITSDELRRLNQDLQIVVYANLKPILARKIQVFATKPWRREIGINSMYGSTRYLLPVAVKILTRGARVTRRGRTKLPTKSSFWLILGYLLRSLAPSSALVLAMVAAIFIYAQGFPHLRVEYSYSGTWSKPTAFHWCRYFGPEQFTLRGGNCPVIIFRKSW